MTQDEVRELGDKCFRIVNKSLERVTENNQADKNWAAEKEADDEDFDAAADAAGVQDEADQALKAAAAAEGHSALRVVTDTAAAAAAHAVLTSVEANLC